MNLTKLVLLSLIATAAHATTTDRPTEIVASVSIVQLALSGSSTAITAKAHVNHTLTPGLAVGINFAWADATTNGAYASTWTILAGPQVFLPTDDVQNAFFLGIGFGLTVARARLTPLAVTATSTEFTWGFEAGKRFRIIDGVSYRPSISFLKVNKLDWVTGITPISFSLHF